MQSNTSFLKAGTSCTSLGNRLSPSAIRAYLCLGSWACHGLVSVSDFLKANQPNSKRKRDEDVEDAEDVKAAKRSSHVSVSLCAA